MIHFVLYSSHAEDNRRILSAVREESAKCCTLQDWDCHTYTDPGRAAEHLAGGGMELISWDMSPPEARAHLSQARGVCREAFLLAVADLKTSPLEFLRPSLAPNSLLLRPLLPPELVRAAREMIHALRLRQAEQESQETFLLSSRTEQRRIPYRAIYYFEARGKKIYLRLHREEVGFTGTLEQLAQTLPEEFVRCHRSYLVNTARIDRIRAADHLLCLWDGLTVPVSRRYQKALKEFYT